MTVVKNILAVIGAFFVLVTAVGVVLTVIGLIAERRHFRTTRNYRATRSAEHVAKDPAMWSDFFVDHDLHKVLRTPKEWKP
ncbi:hypothetical protein ACFV0L_18740 [Streptosporangium canum]|uniref:hypothetical protein n=1 Tax=Streptosporangium canum TaxID=324952 RepID=UPI0036C61490